MEREDKRDIRSLEYSELEEIIAELGEKRFRADQIYGWLHDGKRAGCA